MNTPEHALDALREILRPLARLALAHGVQHAQLAELVKAALVEAAARPEAQEEGARIVSKVSVATGIHRKEVKRLLSAPAGRAPRGRLVASEVFARWISDPRYLDRKKKPRALPRAAGQGRASFESLARSVTRDVHPRAVLEEMKRLKLVEEEGHSVRLLRENFATEDPAQSLGILAANVHDHLAAAVANTTEPPARFLEQALVADELSAESMDELHRLFLDQWQLIMRAILPEMTRLWERDREAAAGPRHRVRLGLFEYGEVTPPGPDPQHPDRDKT